MSVIARGRGTEWQEVYADAISLSKVAPGTVCVTERHYQEGRHLAPYRLGYCHDFGEPTVHYHESYREHLLCGAQS